MSQKHPGELLCRYCLKPVEGHERLVEKNTRKPIPYFKCKQGPLGWLSLKAHCFTATEDAQR